MKFIIDHQTTKAVIGGRDNLKGNLKGELHEYLSAAIPASHFIQRHLAKQGKRFKFSNVHYFMNEAGVFATGLLPMAARFMAEFGIDFEVEDRRTGLPAFDPEGYTTSTPDFNLYLHQVELIDSVNNYLPIGNNQVYFPRGIWKAATNSGKTAAAGCLVKSVLNPKCLFLIDSQDLFDQHIEYYECLFGTIGKIGSVNTGRISQKTGKFIYKYMYEPGEVFTIAMVDTLCSLMDKNVAIAQWLATYPNILIIDECHSTSSGRGARVIQACNAGMRVFMSGTPLPTSNKLNADKIIAMSGDVLKTISKRYLIDNGFSMEPAVRMYLNPETRAGFTFDQEYEAQISRSEVRAGFIADLIAKRTQRKVLTTFFERVHGYLMYDTFITKYPELSDKTAWVHGQDPWRPQKIKDYKEGKITRLFTSEIMRQGINIKDIGTIIRGEGGIDETGLSQFMGRGERLDGVNKRFEWIDLFDTGKHVSKHSRKRIQFYRDEELEITFKYPANKWGSPK